MDNILHQYPTAIKLASYPVSPTIDLSLVTHETSKKPWKGIGLTPLTHLLRYKIGDEPVDQYFMEVAARVMSQ